MSRLKMLTSRPKTSMIASIAVSILLIAGGIWYLSGKNIAVLNPQGIIADKQLTLIVFTTILGMFVIIPVFMMLFSFAYKYRDGRKAKYEPNEEGSRKLELLWWGIPIVIIALLSVITWFTTHDLDPYKKIASDKAPLKVQVVALQWRWLFIYPDQGIATINELRIPEKTPVNFELAADAPMSAFWIPSLGSQIYAMNGMTTKLSLMADSEGQYEGRNTNISGEGYADMQFMTYSMSQSKFDSWITDTQKSKKHLTWAAYEELAEPVRNTDVQYMMLHDDTLFQRVVDKYMGHMSHDETDMSTGETDHSMMNHEGMNN